MGSLRDKQVYLYESSCSKKSAENLGGSLWEVLDKMQKIEGEWTRESGATLGASNSIGVAPFWCMQL